MELKKFAVRYCHQQQDSGMEALFFELLKVALGTQDGLSKNPSGKDWQELFLMCQQQAIIGVAFSTIEKLIQTGIKPPQQVLYNWIGIIEQIKQRNKIVNQNAVKLCNELKASGFECCILKGQGNNLLYPDVFSRQPGDIDVWIRGVRRKKDNIKGIIQFVKKHNPHGIACYHHIDYGSYNDTEIEIHYRPAFMFNPVYNRRLQKWFSGKICEQFIQQVELPDIGENVNIPTVEFNVVFQLAHVYNHVLHEGIGFRQIVDYFYVLHGVGDVELAYYKCSGILRYLGLEKIAGAMMWVLHEKLGLPEEYLIAPMDERRGKVLLSEILRGGNFGYYDSENVKATSRLKKNVQRVKRDLRLMRFFPSECLWEPVFRVYHLFWRMRYN